MPALLVLLGAGWLVYVTRVLDLTPIKNSEGYLMRSDHSLFSQAFYFGPRPFVTSLMYKMYGSSESGAVLGQLVTSTIAWLVLTLALGRLIKNPWLRLVHCLAFPSLMAWWNVMGWNMVMRAESTAFSWLALWCAALVTYCRTPTRLGAGLLGGASFFLCFTRDSLPLLVLPVVGLVVAVEVVRSRFAAPMRSRLGVLVGTIVLIAGFQFVTSQAVIHPQFKTRHEFPLVNVIMQRVLPKPEVRQWFEERGMPVHLDMLKWKKRWASGNRFAVFEKKRYRAFRDWVRSEGKYTYLRYLAAHPDYTVSSAFAARNKIFAHDLDYYTKKAPHRFPFRMLNVAFPLVSPALALVALVWGTWRSIATRGDLVIIAFTALIPLTFVNGLFVFHMDAMEIERHALLGLVVLQIATYVLLLTWRRSGDARRVFHGDAALPQRSDDQVAQ
jgi:hypothetical protein